MDKIPTYWDQATQHLSQDPVMKTIIERYQGETLKARGDAFYTLARSIVGQQISVKAADSIWKRLEQTLHSISAPHVIDAPVETLRQVGLSNSKVIYLKEIAHFFARHKGPIDWPEDDTELLKLLVTIKGVGVWTAEMFMIFHLLRPDVLPLGDIGLLKAIGLHYGDGKNKVSQEVASQIAAPWAPYRSVATWYLWRSLDPVPVEY